MSISTPSEQPTPVNRNQFFSALSTAKWPSKEVLAGEALFTTFLTDSDLEALHAAAGLGPLGWWLDPDCADGKIDSPTYEEEVAMIAWAREPFERAGEIRDASRGLLDRLNELERLKNLADERARSKPPLANRGKKSEGEGLSNIYHSTLSLASDLFTEEGVPLPKKSEKLPVSPSGRRDTYAVHNQQRYHTNGNQFMPPKAPLTSSPKVNQGGNSSNMLVSPRFCKSPERRDSIPSRQPGQKLQRTYSKNSLHMLAEDSPATLQRNTNNAAADSNDYDDNQSYLSNKLGRTYDADELSDVFPSPHASLENFNPHAPPVTPSTNMPQASARKTLLTYNANSAVTTVLNRSADSPVLDIARQQEAKLRASISRNSLRGSNEAVTGMHHQQRRSDTQGPPPLRIVGESPTRSSNLATIPASPLDAAHHKTSAPAFLHPSNTEVRTSLPALRTDTSNHSLTNFSDALNLAKLQEANLRASSGEKKNSNSSLNGSYQDRLNQSLPVDDTNKEEGVVGMFLRQAPHEAGTKQYRNPVERKRFVQLPNVRSTGDLATAKDHSTSQTSLGHISSEQLQDMLRRQELSLRISTEEVLQRKRSQNSLTKSIESARVDNFTDSDSDIVTLPKPELSRSNPSLHHNVLNTIDSSNLAQQASLRGSGDTYDVSRTALKSSSDFTPPVRQSVSPVRVRNLSKTVPPLLSLPIDTEVKLSPSNKETPNSATTVRPSSYTDQLQNPENPGSAVEAWVKDTLAIVPDNLLKLSIDSANITICSDGVGDSVNTEVILSGDKIPDSHPLQPTQDVVSSMVPPTSSSSVQMRPRLVEAPSNLVNSIENVAVGAPQMGSKLRPPITIDRAPSATTRTRIIAPAAIRSRGRTSTTTVSIPRGVPPRPLPTRGVVQRHPLPTGLAALTVPARQKPVAERVPISGLPSSRMPNPIVGAAALATRGRAIAAPATRGGLMAAPATRGGTIAASAIRGGAITAPATRGGATVERGRFTRRPP